MVWSSLNLTFCYLFCLPEQEELRVTPHLTDFVCRERVRVLLSAWAVYRGVGSWDWDSESKRLRAQLRCESPATLLLHVRLPKVL